MKATSPYQFKNFIFPVYDLPNIFILLRLGLLLRSSLWLLVILDKR